MIDNFFLVDCFGLSYAESNCFIPSDESDLPLNEEKNPGSKTMVGPTKITITATAILS